MRVCFFYNWLCVLVIKMTVLSMLFDSGRFWIAKLLFVSDICILLYYSSLFFRTQINLLLSFEI